MAKLRRTKKASAARVGATHDAQADATRAALRAQAILDARMLVDMTRVYFLRNSKLPESLADLTKEDTQGERLVDEVPTDPWGNAYKIFPGAKPHQVEVRSAGPDGKHGTKDDLSNKSNSAL